MSAGQSDYLMVEDSRVRFWHAKSANYLGSAVWVAWAKPSRMVTNSPMEEPGDNFCYGFGKDRKTALKELDGEIFHRIGGRE